VDVASGAFMKLATLGPRQRGMQSISSVTSKSREAGFAGPQAECPRGGQRISRSDKRGGHYLRMTFSDGVSASM